MFDDELAGLYVVGGVDADGDATSHDAAEEGDEPLWRVETYDVDCGVLRLLEGYQRFAKVKALLVVLFVVVGELGRCRSTHCPFTFEERADLRPCFSTESLNSSMRVVGT